MVQPETLIIRKAGNYKKKVVYRNSSSQNSSNLIFLRSYINNIEDTQYEQNKIGCGVYMYNIHSLVPSIRRAAQHVKEFVHVFIVVRAYLHHRRPLHHLILL